MSFTPNQRLIFAARAGNNALAEKLLTGGADPNYSDPSQGSAALESVRRGHARLLSKLLDQGLSPSSPAAAGHGGLIEAALRNENEEIATLLAEHGFRLVPHARSIFRARLARVFANRKRKIEQSGPANGGKPIRSKTRRTPSAAGSRR